MELESTSNVDFKIYVDARTHNMDQYIHICRYMEKTKMS